MSNNFFSNSHSGQLNMIIIGDNHFTRFVRFKEKTDSLKFHYYGIDQIPIEFHRFSGANKTPLKTFTKQIIVKFFRECVFFR